MILKTHEQVDPDDSKTFVSVIVAALNEEDAIAQVIRAVPRNIADEIIVVDNGSTDRTAEVARAAGARVVHEPNRGYGAACLAGLARLRDRPPEIVAFLD